MDKTNWIFKIFVFRISFQGVTELLPISSSGHLVIFEELLTCMNLKMIFWNLY